MDSGKERLVVLTYNRKFDCVWQVINKDGSVISAHKTREEANIALDKLDQKV